VKNVLVSVVLALVFGIGLLVYLALSVLPVAVIVWGVLYYLGYSVPFLLLYLATFIGVVVMDIVRTVT
jgi:hypothetical protein